MNKKFIKGITDFIRANQKNIKIPLKEFIYYVYFYKNVYPSDLEKRLKNLKRDWKKDGYVKGFATAFNVYNKLKKAKYVTDILPLEQQFYKLKSYYSNQKNISGVETLYNNVYDYFFDLGQQAYNVRVDLSKLNLLKIGELSKAGAIIGLFLTPISTVTQEQEDDILNKAQQEYYRKKTPPKKQKEKSGTLDKALPIATATASLATSGIGLLFAIGAGLFLLTKRKK